MKSLRTIGKIISQLSYDVFLITLIGYIVALSLESMKAGTVVRYFNLNNLFIALVVSGALAILLPHPEMPLRNTKWYYVGLVVVSLFLGFIVFQLTVSLGVWSYVSAAVCTLILCSAGILIKADS